MPPIVCVINLARDVDRWKKISASLASLKLQVTRIRAVDARRKRGLMDRVTGGNRYSQAMNRNLTPGECACALSHVAALRRIVRNGHAYGIVLEDDAVMDERFKEFVERDLEGYLAKCDVVKIEGIQGEARKRRGLLLQQSSITTLILPFVPTQGSAGYAVTRKGAQRLMKEFRGLSDPIDFMLSFYERHGCSYGEVRPILIQQDIPPREAAQSNLESERLVAYSPDATQRTSLQKAGKVIGHDIGRRLWRMVTIGLYALRFRTLVISPR